MFLMQADTLHGQVGGGWALEIASYLGQMALAYWLDAISQSPKNSPSPHRFFKNSSPALPNYNCPALLYLTIIVLHWILYSSWICKHFWSCCPLLSTLSSLVTGLDWFLPSFVFLILKILTSQVLSRCSCPGKLPILLGCSLFLSCPMHTFSLLGLLSCLFLCCPSWIPGPCPFLLLSVFPALSFILFCILAQVGLGISDKKIIPRKTELTEQMVISDGIPAVPGNRISRNSVSEPFRGIENISEFRSAEQK